MTKIAVTGANGFVGQHLIHELTANNYEVLEIDGRITDLTDPVQVEQLNFRDIDGIIHLAGLAAVGPSFDNPQQYMDVNVGCEINLFEAAMKQGVHPKTIIVSSGSLYDPKATLPITEQSPVLPSSPYAVSKLAQEEMAQYYTTRGFEVVIARPFNHIGPGQNPGFIVPDLTQQLMAVEKGEASNIQVGNLDAKRDYTDVRDIARAYRLLYEKGISGQTYNICSGTSLSGHEILDGLLDVSGIQAEVIQDPNRMRPSDTPDIYGSHNKLTADTGWEPNTNIGQTLTDVIADWRSR